MIAAGSGGVGRGGVVVGRRGGGTNNGQRTLWTELFGGLRAPVPPRASVLEVAHAGEDHGEPVLVGGGDDLFVLDRAAGLDDRPWRPPWRSRRRRRGTGRRRRRRRPCRPAGSCGLQRREARGVDAAHLAGAHADRLHARSRRRSRSTSRASPPSRRAAAPSTPRRSACACVTTSHFARSSRCRSHSWASSPPITRRRSKPVTLVDGRSCPCPSRAGSSSRRAPSWRSASKPGAITASTNTLGQLAARRRRRACG